VSKTSTAQRTKEVGIDSRAPFQWPDATSTAQLVLDEALTFCARKADLENAQVVVDCLRQGDGVVCHYYRYGLAKSVAESIGRLDDNVKAVYTVDYDATPEDRCFSSETNTSPIHLIVWAERKTDALNALVEALNRALVEAYSEMIEASHLSHLLDVQVVDDADVEARVGYGALLTSIHNRPIQVWER